MYAVSNRQYDSIVKFLRYYERFETNLEHRRKLRLLSKSLAKKKVNKNESVQSV